MSGNEKIPTIHNCSGKQKDVMEPFRRTGQKKNDKGTKSKQPGVRLILVYIYPSWGQNTLVVVLFALHFLYCLGHCSSRTWLTDWLADWLD